MSSQENQSSRLQYMPLPILNLLCYGQRYMDVIDVEMCTNWFNNVAGKKTNDMKIISFINTYYTLHNTLPSRDKIEREFCRVSCLCELSYPEEKIIEMKKHMIFKLARTLKDCRETEIVLEYEMLHKKFPLEKELKEYIKRLREFEEDPVQYFNNDKVDRPAKFDDNLIKYPSEEIKENCSICFEHINKSPYYQLSCNHYFHSEKNDCLGEANIVDWLKKNNFCPNCKKVL